MGSADKRITLKEAAPILKQQESEKAHS